MSVHSLFLRYFPAVIIAALAAFPQPGYSQAAAARGIDLANLGLEDLMNVEVTSVSRKTQRLNDTAAAVFVVSGEDIRRSGATSIPEALRMVPGLQVARIANDKWAISARGFAGRFSNKLLVLMDGRTLYSPLFSGVLWEAQDTLLDDIDRIEVIRGPGAALWGANAVNGVINIITKKAKDTQGGLALAGAGTQEKGSAALRYGNEAGEDTQYRVYAKTYARGASVDMNGRNAGDDSRSLKSGFRLDRRLSAGERFTMTGDLYEVHSGESWAVPQLLPPYSSLVPMAERNRGVNLLARYDRTFDDGSAAIFQAYVDSTGLAATPFIREQRDTFDLDFQHRLALGSRHDVIWGLNYRQSRDDLISTGNLFSIFPQRGDFRLVSAFVHDDISLVRDRLRLILGAKLEHNSYTGTEPQPNLRLLWTPAPAHTFWGALSRAVRTPSRSERETTVDLSVLAPFAAGNPSPFPVLTRSSFVPGVQRLSEKLNALELGYRAQIDPRLSLDLTVFSNHYASLRSVATGPVSLEFAPFPYVLQQVYMDNGLSGDTAGLEASIDWRPLNWQRWQASYTLLRMSFPVGADSARNALGQFFADSAPRSQLSLRSMTDLAPGHQLDLWLRHVSGMAWGDVPAYTTLDARYGWRPRNNLELSFVGQNLLKARHPEFFLDFASAPLLQAQRGFYVQAKWRY
jgi:iron complex outermembrane receptor protein